MNTSSSDLNQSTNTTNCCSGMICFGKRHVHHRAVYTALGALAAVLFVVISSLGTFYQITPQSAVITHLQKSLKRRVFVSEKHVATDNLIDKLKQHGMWELQPSQVVPRFFIESYPADLNAVTDVSIRKRVFLHSLLPHALFVRQKALRKRGRLEFILSKIDCPLQDINFDAGLEYETRCSWADFLVEDEVNFIQELSIDYRVTTAEGLLECVDAVPISIILAQGALESSWGSSRFTREGNSVFGMWTWKTKGMVPSMRDEGKTHKVKVYESVLDSVRAYQLTLNRLEPYAQFRQLRLQTDNPLLIAEGLAPYSERGDAYVEDIQNVIRSNDLQKYDSYRLSDFDLPEFSGPAINSILPDGSGKNPL